MPDIITAAPPAPPAPPDPPKPPATPVTAPPAPAQAEPLPGTQVRKPFSLDDDPNHQMQRLIAKRKTKKPDEPEDKTKITPGTPPPEPEPPKTPQKTDEPGDDVGSVIAKALKFRQKAPKKQDPAPPEPPKTPEDKKTPEETGKKTIVKKVKAPAAAADAVRMASEAAVAATREAVAALLPQKPTEKPDTNLEDQLHADDRKEYEVAKFLAERDPKYKDAPATILSHVKQVEQYVKRWEQANPGKAFDRDDEEHDDFYAKLQKPWTDHEYETAKEDMAVERVLAKKNATTEPEIQKLKAENARLALQPIIDRTYTSVAAELARAVDPIAHGIIVKDGFDKLLESDPIAAEALAETITELRPFIETAIHIDDPNGRVPFDKDNEHHQAWLEFLNQKESEFSGAEYEGKQFATRRQYAAMNKAQRANHWYLTVDLLVSEMVKDTAAAVAKSIENEKKRQEKIALAMGYVPKTASNGTPTQSLPTQRNTTTTTNVTNNSPPKPDSPTVGTGAKIDQPGGGGDKGLNGLLAATGKILFNR